MLPPAFRLPIPHQQIGFSQFSGGAKVQDLAVQPAFKHGGSVAKWAKSYDDGHARDRVVDDFMPD